MRVLILGSSGLIGHQIYYHLLAKGKYELCTMSNTRKVTTDSILCDARDENRFLSHVRDFAPDVIINAMGVLIQGANADPKNAIFLNAYMPHRLASVADEFGGRFIHISTDCVFSGRRGGYSELDEKDGLDVYAKAKGLGEIIDDRHLTLRTSVVGPELKNDGEELFGWFMSQEGDINGYTKALWSGVTTMVLAKAVELAIHSSVTGLHHVTNGSPISKYDLLNLFKRHTRKDINIRPFDNKMVDKSFIDTRKELGLEVSSYEEMVVEMVAWIENNSALYPHYKIGKN